MYYRFHGFIVNQFVHISTLSFRWKTFTGLIITGDSVTATIIDTCIQTEWFVETIETVLGLTATWDVTIEH